jgi:uncharacterized protein YdeI (YjbR/CyaY-like superfamily)
VVPKTGSSTQAAARFFRSAADFRRWLEAHHAQAPELLVGFYKKESGRGGLTYAQALDEVLCFGWIDGIRKGLDPVSYTIRFTPRRKRSIWSQVNLRHMDRLMAAGRVQPAGRAAYQQRDRSLSKSYSFENDAARLSPAETKRFRAHRQAWEFFQSLRSSQRKGLTWWIVSAKKEETRRRRLDALVATCARGEFDPLRPPKTR